MIGPAFRIQSGLTYKELLLVVAMFGILWFIAYPNFISFDAISMQAEAKTNLRAAATAQKAYKNSFGRNAVSFKELVGFRPQNNRRYAYILGQDVMQPDAAGAVEIDEHTLPAAVRENRKQQETSDDFTVYAVGRINRKHDFDVWVIDQNLKLSNLFDAAKVTWKEILFE